jgi:hypothetical protein
VNRQIRVIGQTVAVARSRRQHHLRVLAIRVLAIKMCNGSARTKCFFGMRVPLNAGRTLIAHAGEAMAYRGSLDPSVCNPTRRPALTVSDRDGGRRSWYFLREESQIL